MCRSSVSLLRPRFGVDLQCQSPPLSLGSGTSQDAMTVLLVEERPAFSFVLSDKLRSVGIEVVQAASMADVRREHVGRGVDLLILDVDRTDEASWLRAADYRRTHPDVRVWVYTSWSSPVDATLADFVPVEELIYYNGDPCDLADEIAFRLAAYGQRTDVVTNINGRAEVPAAVA